MVCESWYENNYQRFIGEVKEARRATVHGECKEKKVKTCVYKNGLELSYIPLFDTIELKKEKGEIQLIEIVCANAFLYQSAYYITKHCNAFKEIEKKKHLNKTNIKQ